MGTTVINDNTSSATTKRIRRTPEASRAAVLDSAQRLLIEQGPPAVTLKAVAMATGMTHGNVTHHFGTSALLQTALIARMATSLSDQVAQAAIRLRRQEISEPDLVEIVFVAFVETGCGRLIGWLSASRQQEALAPIFQVVEVCIRQLRAGEPAATDGRRSGAGPMALGLVSLALTASLIGAPLEQATDMPKDSLKYLAAEQLRQLRAT